MVEVRQAGEYGHLLGRSVGGASSYYGCVRSPLAVGRGGVRAEVGGEARGHCNDPVEDVGLGEGEGSGSGKCVWILGLHGHWH